jgi:hypothetical protein
VARPGTYGDLLLGQDDCAVLPLEPYGHDVRGGDGLEGIFYRRVSSAASARSGRVSSCIPTWYRRPCSEKMVMCLSDAVSSPRRHSVSSALPASVNGGRQLDALDILTAALGRRLESSSTQAVSFCGERQAWRGKLGEVSVVSSVRWGTGLGGTRCWELPWGKLHRTRRLKLGVTCAKRRSPVPDYIID